MNVYWLSDVLGGAILGFLVDFFYSLLPSPPANKKAQIKEIYTRVKTHAGCEVIKWCALANQPALLKIIRKREHISYSY